MSRCWHLSFTWACVELSSKEPLQAPSEDARAVDAAVLAALRARVAALERGAGSQAPAEPFARHAGDREAAAIAEHLEVLELARRAPTPSTPGGLAGLRVRLDALEASPAFEAAGPEAF